MVSSAEATLAAAHAEQELERKSAVLQRLAAEHPGPEIRMGEVVAALGERGLGLAMLLLAVPNLLPGPVMPGYSTIFGIPIAAVEGPVRRSLLGIIDTAAREYRELCTAVGLLGHPTARASDRLVSRGERL